jgi:hypothetical protein
LSNWRIPWRENSSFFSTSLIQFFRRFWFNFFDVFDSIFSTFLIQFEWNRSSAVVIASSNRTEGCRFKSRRCINIGNFYIAFLNKF